MDYRPRVLEVLASVDLAPGEGGVLPEVDAQLSNLAMALEEAVGVMIPVEELTPENFRTLDGIVSMLQRIDGGRIEGS
jgi:hypothetical protein